MQRLIFEYSPYYILLCAALGLAYAWLLYTSHYTWSKRTNQALFAIRAIVVSVLAFLLLGPIIKLVKNEFEKPTWVLLLDTSGSVSEVMDSVEMMDLFSKVQAAKSSLENEGYEVSIKDFLNQDINNFRAELPVSDINRSIQQVITDYEGKNLAGITLVSDGIYNSGSSPLYSTFRLPVYTIGIGDTVTRKDLVLKNVVYNKVAYQGNKFPLKVQVVSQGMGNEPVTVEVRNNTKLVSTITHQSADKSLIDFDFILDANEKGVQRFDVLLKAVTGESNLKNNTASIFIEVVEGKKKILLIAPAPHPDIKAIRSVIEKNPNYEFLVHIPGVTNVNQENLKPGAAELIIFHEAFDNAGRTAALYNALAKGPSSILLLMGSQTNFRQLAANGIPIQFDLRGQWDDVTPIINQEFRDFSFSENSNGTFARYPPASVPFGKFTYPPKSQVLLFQRIGSVVTDRPMLLAWEDNQRKIAAMIAEGIWRWRLNEFADNSNTEAFDELFSKLIQYLSTLEDKRKFRAYPIQNEFTDFEPVVIESQVYNDLFEIVYGNTIQLEVRDEQGKVSNYSYTINAGSSRYRISGLTEGSYQFKATTIINGKTEDVRGKFLVKAQNLEAQGLTADFDLLRKLAFNTGGKFYPSEKMAEFTEDVSQKETTSLIHSEESFDQLINLKWVFFLLLVLISTEWFLRKYMGSY